MQNDRPEREPFFAEDGTVEKVVPVGSEEAEAEVGSESANIKENSEEVNSDKDKDGNWEQPKSKRRKSEKGDKNRSGRKSK